MELKSQNFSSIISRFFLIYLIGLLFLAFTLVFSNVVLAAATPTPTPTLKPTPTPTPIPTPTITLSGYSDCVSPPGPPTVHLSWTSTYGYDNYEVYRDGVRLITLLGVTSTDRGESDGSGVTHSWYIRGYNNFGALPGPVNSNTVTITNVICVTPTPTLSSGSVQLCQNIDYLNCETFTVDDPDLSNNAVGNNTASSIRVPSGTTVSLYEPVNYGGTCETFTADDPDLRNNAVGNDTASSIRIGSACPVPTPTPTPPPPDLTIDRFTISNLNPSPGDVITATVDYSVQIPSAGGGFGASVLLCAAADYIDCETFTADDADLRNNAVGNDTASSIKVPQGVIVSLYDTISYGGVCETFTADDPLFTDNLVGNDTVTSIKVGTGCPGFIAPGSFYSFNIAVYANQPTKPACENIPTNLSTLIGIGSAASVTRTDGSYTETLRFTAPATGGSYSSAGFVDFFDNSGINPIICTVNESDEDNNFVTLAYAVIAPTPTPTPTPSPSTTPRPCSSYDFDGDGAVDADDLSLVSARFGTSVGDPNYDPLYDVNNDTSIDLRDQLIVSSCISPTPTPTATPSGGSPCPTTNPPYNMTVTKSSNSVLFDWSPEHCTDVILYVFRGSTTTHYCTGSTNLSSAVFSQRRNVGEPSNTTWSGGAWETAFPGDRFCSQLNQVPGP